MKVHYQDLILNSISSLVLFIDSQTLIHSFGVGISILSSGTIIVKTTIEIITLLKSRKKNEKESKGSKAQKT